MQYLSQEWFNEANSKLKKLAPVADISISTTVTKSDKTEINYCLHLGPEKIFYSYDCDNSQIQFITNWETAIKIAQDLANPKKEILKGEVVIHGNPEILTEHAKTITSIEDELSELRFITDYES